MLKVKNIISGKIFFFEFEACFMRPLSKGQDIMMRAFEAEDI